MKRPVYLDNNATTPVDRGVLEAMLPYFGGDYGNASSVHHPFGWRAKDAVTAARGQVAAVFGGRAEEIVFTSGATESNNLAIKGVARACRERGRHIVTCETEHKAVLDPCRALEREGFSVTRLPVDRDGLIDLDHLRDRIGNETILVSVMAANNETGVLQPIAPIGELCRSKGVFFHTDAAQAFGKIPLSVEDMQIDLLSVSGHKIYGPKGVGALYVRRAHPQVKILPLMHGGGHESGLRSGTLNVPGIVGLGKAADLAVKEMADEAGRQKRLRDRLASALQEQLDEVVLNGHPQLRLPNTANLTFTWVEAEALMLGIDDIAVSIGSACTGESEEISHVLRAMSIPDPLARSSIRFSLGRFTQADEIDYTIGRVIEQVKRLRELAPIDDLKRMPGFASVHSKPM